MPATVPREAGLYAIELGATVAGGVIRQSVNTGTEVMSEGTSGDVYPRSNFITAQRSGAAYESKHLKSHLDITTLFGKDITTLSGGLKMYLQKLAVAGARATGSVHRKFTIAKGVLLLRSITCEHQGDAVAVFEAIATSDGTNAPIIEADTSALPTSVADAERFSLGPVTIGGVVIDGIRRFELDMGMNVTREGAGSEVWDYTVAIRDIKPKLKISGIDYEWLKSTNIPFTGKAAAHADSKAYLRKRADASTFVADGTASHIKFTMAGMCYIDQAFDARNNAPGEVSLCLETKYDGTNAPLILNTAIAVT